MKKKNLKNLELNLRNKCLNGKKDKSKTDLE